MKFSLLFTLMILPLCSMAQHELVCSKFLAKERMSGQRLAPKLTDPRQNDYDVKFYFLDLEADNSSTDIAGTVTIKAEVTAGMMNEFVVELADELDVSQILVNGSPATFTHSDNLLVTTLPSAASESQLLDVTITYGGTPPADAGFFAGISNDLAEFDIPVTWTLSEPFNASDWFPVKQVLTDKADSANIYITVPDNLMAAAAGTLVNTTPVAGNKMRYEWETRYPIAYYLLSMAIAPYQLIEQETILPGVSEPVTIQHFIYDELQVIENVADKIDLTPDMVLFFSQLFGTYPFAEEKYGHAMAPMGGGMEHQTISTMAGFSFTLMAHELLHQWYGDDITCETWQDIWINEGFARYGEYLALEKLIAEQEADAWMKVNYDNVLSQPGGSVFVPEEGANNPNRIFDFRLTYNKGGALLHMLRYVIGNDELFFNGMKAYTAEFSGGHASGADFRDFMENFTGVSLTSFFDEWYYGEGYPTYEFDWEFADGILTINLKQKASAPEVTPFFSTPLPLLITTSGGPSMYRITPESAQQQFTFDIGPVADVEFDPRNIILKKTGVITSTSSDLTYGFKAYPNPATDVLFVEVTSGLSYQATLTDIQGRTMKQMLVSPDNLNQISTADLSPGMYLLQLRNSHGTWVNKVRIIH